jgi:hypothetical protein
LQAAVGAGVFGLAYWSLNRDHPSSIDSRRRIADIEDLGDKNILLADLEREKAVTTGHYWTGSVPEKKTPQNKKVRTVT